MTKEALKQALEFVEFCGRDVNMNDYASEKRDIIENVLEEALTQPEQKWVGLTADEYHTIRNSTWEISEAIRFTEAKLKEKNFE